MDPYVMIALAGTAALLYGCVKYRHWPRLIPLLLGASAFLVSIAIPALGGALATATSSPVGIAVLVFADGVGIFVIWHEILTGRHHHPRRTPTLATLGGFAAAATWINLQLLRTSGRNLPGQIASQIRHGQVNAHQLTGAHLTATQKPLLIFAAAAVVVVWVVFGRRMKKIYGSTKMDPAVQGTLSPKPVGMGGKFLKKLQRQAGGSGSRGGRGGRPQGIPASAGRGGGPLPPGGQF